MLLLSLLFACGPKNSSTNAVEKAQVTESAPASESTSGASIEPPEETPDWLAHIPSEGSTIKLISAGEDPKYPLLYSTTPTKKPDTYKMDMITNMELNMMGEEVVQNFTMTMMMDMSIDDVTEEGNYISTSTFTETLFSSEDPALTAALSGTGDMLKGLSVVSTFSPSGVLLEQNYDIPEGTPPQIVQSMQNSSNSLSQTSLGFPTGKLGKGAQWEILSLTETQGMETSQRILCTLTEFDGTTGSVEATVDQRINPADMPPGASIENFYSNGTMNYNFNLQTPNDSEIVMDMDTSFTITNYEGLSQPMKMKITLTGALVE